jgi:2-dehydro-3-deoxy-D-arabinonate dehydratase
MICHCGGGGGGGTSGIQLMSDVIYKLARFSRRDQQGPRVGVWTPEERFFDLGGAGVGSLGAILESANPARAIRDALGAGAPEVPGAEVRLLAPADEQEVWAAGVTYLRSKKARMEESDFSASAYDRVYEAARPEIFFKSLGSKVAGPDTEVGIREDARWNVPEPELALVLNSRRELVGYTIGNDMSSRDIEGENLLYLPQAKTYHRSCGLGPWIIIGASEEMARSWTIRVAIERGGAEVFSGETSVGQIKRSFDELSGYLFRSQRFPSGAVLLTGTGVVPPDTFTLAAGDKVTICVSGIGSLANTVAVV